MKLLLFGIILLFIIAAAIGNPERPHRPLKKSKQPDHKNNIRPLKRQKQSEPTPEHNRNT